MTKSKVKQEQEEQERRDIEFMHTIENNTTGNWLCGIRSNDQDRPSQIWGHADTEETAEKYMMLRYNRNGGEIPHRLLDEVGWWRND